MKILFFFGKTCFFVENIVLAKKNIFFLVKHSFGKKHDVVENMVFGENIVFW